jgi:hypothetical protein
VSTSRKLFASALYAGLAYESQLCCAVLRCVAICCAWPHFASRAAALRGSCPLAAHVVFLCRIHRCLRLGKCRDSTARHRSGGVCGKCSTAHNAVIRSCVSRAAQHIALPSSAAHCPLGPLAATIGCGAEDRPLHAPSDTVVLLLCAALGAGGSTPMQVIHLPLPSVLAG